jgi:hypothetical protein
LRCGRRNSHFGSPLALSRVHWVRPELVAEVKFLTWPRWLYGPNRYVLELAQPAQAKEDKEGQS